MHVGIGSTEHNLHTYTLMFVCLTCTICVRVGDHWGLPLAIAAHLHVPLKMKIIGAEENQAATGQRATAAASHHVLIEDKPGKGM